jgi:hypothetical protein
MPGSCGISRFTRTVAAAALAVSAGTLAGCGQPAPPGPPGPAQLRSRYEVSRGVSIGRDCGYSQPLPGSPGRSIWLFCDTPVFTSSKNARGRTVWGLRQFITGSTAAEASSTPGRPPGELTELPTPGTGAPPAGAASPGGAASPAGAASPVSGDPAPARFLPQPPGLVTLGGQPCTAADGGYAASWISGTARIPGSTDLLIAYDNYCVITGAHPGFIAEGFGLARYDPAANRLTSQNAVFTGTNFSGPASAQMLGSPVFRGGYLYLFGPECSYPALGGCGRGEIAVARVAANPLAWANPFAYRWWSGPARGGSWTPQMAAATSVIPAAKPSGVGVADFSATGHGLVLVEQTDVAGRFTVYQSPGPSGPWTRVLRGRAPCAIAAGFANFCRAINPHPELSTRGWLLLSYFDPSAHPDGHVMVDGFRW